jgi:integrase
MKIYKWTSKITGAVKYGVDYRDAAGKRCQRIVADTKKQAEDIGAKIQVELREGKYFDRKEVVEVTLEELIARYEEHFKTKDSFVTECYHLAAIAGHFGKKTLISSITEESVKRFVNARLEVGSRNGGKRTNATINRELWALKRLLYKAVDWKLLRENPAHKVEPLEEQKKRISYLTEEQCRGLLDAAKGSRNHLLFPILLTALKTGMRREEILGVRHSDIDWAKQMIHLADTKNGKDRYVPISNSLLMVLQEIPRNSEYLFSGNGKPMHDVRTGFEVARKKAGIPSTFRFHDLRHTFVTHTLDAGVQVHVVAEIVGHTLVAMIEKYGHVLEGRKLQAVNQLPSWGKAVA